MVVDFAVNAARYRFPLDHRCLKEHVDTIFAGLSWVTVSEGMSGLTSSSLVILPLLRGFHIHMSWVLNTK